MNVLHDSRALEYRAPYGAVEPGEGVSLAIDVADEPGAVVTLRTWTQRQGEALYEMTPSPLPSGEARAADTDTSTRTVRWQATITPSESDIVWYHFIITRANGEVKRYGAIAGFVGGKGQLVDWEPPSFQLTVHAPGDLPLAFPEVVGGYFRAEGRQRTLAERVATLRENYPYKGYLTAYPWNAPTHDDVPPWSPWPAMGTGIEAATPAIGEGNPGDAPEDAAETPAFPCFAVNDDVFGFWSRDDAGCLLCTLVNTAPDRAFSIAVPLETESVSELTQGYEVAVIDTAEGKRFANAHLDPFGACVLHFHDSQRLQLPMEDGLGVLAHITSLPTDNASRGTLGEPAIRFVDWLAQAGVRYWQVLPANPVDGFGSPYAGISAFAGNVGLLEGAGAHDDPAGPPRPLAKVARLKSYRQFCADEASWLEPYAAFMAIRQKLGEHRAWQDWPAPYHRFDPGVIAADADLSRDAEGWRQAQFLFERQWGKLRAYANEHGVLIVGDMPIYVSGNSADVWAHPELFQLGADGLPASVAGCAPDAFSPDGQVWGNPLYDWDACRAEGYAWWLARLQRAFRLYDIVRLDHFIGFSRYFSIPAGEKAAAGTYRRGPGFELFQRAFEHCGPLPVIAEDLGLITPAVRDLGESCGFPGMDIVQFVDGNDPLAGYRPRPGKIAYTGTHDNQTLVGYCQQRYPQLDARATAEAIMESVATCSAPVSVIPLQDLMGLGDEARMNVPGTAEGNWVWQAEASALPAAQDQARKLVALRES